MYHVSIRKFPEKLQAKLCFKLKIHIGFRVRKTSLKLREISEREKCKTSFLCLPKIKQKYFFVQNSRARASHTHTRAIRLKKIYIHFFHFTFTYAISPIPSATTKRTLNFNFSSLRRDFVNFNEVLNFHSNRACIKFTRKNASTAPIVQQSRIFTLYSKDARNE